VDRRAFLCTTVLFLVALILRITGLLGFVALDENWAVPVRVLVGELSPYVNFYPPLFAYLCAGCYVLMFVVGRLTGVWYSTADFRAQYFIDPTPFIFIGRLLSAFLGALAVPLAVLLARRLSLSWKSALLVGLMVCLLPVDVFLSHIGKSDAAAASAVLLLAWSVLRKIEEPDARSADFLMGLAAALAVSFKQTATLVVLSSIAGMVLVLGSWNRMPPARIARGLVITLATAAVSWIPMNIGTVLAPGNYLEYQALLGQMYSKRDPLVQTMAHLAEVLRNNVSGYTPIGLAAAMIAPLCRRDRNFLVLWVSALFALVTFAIVASRRIVLQHYLPSGVLFFTLGCIAVVSLLERRGFWRVAGLLGSSALLGFTIFGSFQVVTQALRPPLRIQLAEAIKKSCQPEGDKILAATADLGLPISPEASRQERSRHERLAAKYGVELPKQPPERERALDRHAGGYHIRSFPWSMGGMEELSPEEAKIIKPFAWPIQQEEWKLDYWIAQGFNIYVVGDEGTLLRHPVEEYRSFINQIKQSCDLMDVIPCTRPLFDQALSDYRVYKLRKPAAAPGRSAAGSPVLDRDAGYAPLAEVHACHFSVGRALLDVDEMHDPISPMSLRVAKRIVGLIDELQGRDRRRLQGGNPEACRDRSIRPAA
jgi:hypothetical protein